RVRPGSSPILPAAPTPDHRAMEPELPSDPSPPPAETGPAVGDARPDDTSPAEPTSGDTAPSADASAADPPPAEPTAGGWAPGFQVLRSRTDRKLGGVAGGLAVATGLDPVLVRFAVVLACLTGWGLLLYLVAWAVIPEEDPARWRVLMPAPERTGKHLRIGLAVLAGLGVLQVLGAVLGILSSALIGLGLFPFRIFGLAHRRFVPGEAFLGLLLLAGGLVLLFRRHLPWVPADGPGAVAGPWTATGAWPSSPAGPSAAAGTSAFSGPSAAGPPGANPSAAWGPTASSAAGSPAPASPGFGARASAAARAAVTNGPLLLVRAVGWLVGLWFLAAAVLGGLLWLTGAVHLHLPVIPIAAGLAAVGTLGYALLRTRRPAAVVGAMALLLVPAALAF